ncbi:MAG: type III PLP-dependent enzyme [Pseudomonadota bacterium]
MKDYEASSVEDEVLTEAARTFGTPCYVYFCDRIESRIQELSAAFGGRFSQSFAAKCNPNPGVLEFLNSRIDFLDVSSIGELRLALQAGWHPSQASFTGPGKREFEIREAIESGIGELVIESVREALIADQIAASLDRRQNVLLRLSPTSVPKGFGDRMAGQPCAFGIDAEAMASEIPKIQSLKNISICGLHIYSGTQSLNPAAICENYQNFVGLFQECCTEFDITPQKLIFGSGLGVAYHEKDVPLDLDAIANETNAVLDALKQQPRFSNTQLILELGRYLVGDAGFFVTRVISVKESRGSRIGICDGGLNNHLPASGNFGMVIRRNYKMHKIGKLVQPGERVDLVGPLCTSIDKLATGITLPRISEGDLIAIHNSGAYGLTASPIHFISHKPPSEVIVNEHGLVDVTRQLGDISHVS